MVDLGFRYLRMAADGGSFEGGGRRSSVSSGLKSKIEAPRNSSGCNSGAVVAIVDTVKAADFNAFSEAVRLDLKEL